MLWLSSLDSRSNLNGNNRNLNYDNNVREMASSRGIIKMPKTYKNIYKNIYQWENLILAFKKAKRGKTKKYYVKQFQENLPNSLLDLQHELKIQAYEPKPLKTFILRDPKTRKISKSNFRDRIIHHAICNIIEPIFQKAFIHDSCANQKRKGNLFAIKRFYKFSKQISNNGLILKNKFNDTNYILGYCFKADIKHYFQEVNHEILLKIIKRKIKDKETIQLMQCILKKASTQQLNKGMPLGNLTSQFFANVYLNELDYFIKHKLKTKYYIRYVDDFIIFSKSKEQLKIWKNNISNFLKQQLNLELHPQKSKIIPLSKGVDFVGFRNFYHFKILRRRNIKKMDTKITKYKLKNLTKKEILSSFQGWNAYAKWANSYKLRKKTVIKIYNHQS